MEIIQEQKNFMPRLDLHCHLDGSLSRTFFEEILGRRVEMEELQVAPDCRNLAEYLAKFSLPFQGIQTARDLRYAGYDFMRSVKADALDYVEVRFAPVSCRMQGLDVRTAIESVLDGVKRGREEFGIDFGVIVCAMRGHSEEDNLAMLRTAREFLGAGVCAADLAGDEASWPMRGFRELFGEVKRMGMPFTLHAGECGSVENIAEAVDCGAARIGHGVAMSGHKDVMRLCRDRHIGIEMCPTSNVQTRAVPGFDRYPMREFLDEGLLVTVNTDNRTISGTTLEKEIRVAREQCGVSDEDIVQMMRNAVEISFAPDEVKHRLWKQFGGRTTA